MEKMEYASPYNIPIRETKEVRKWRQSKQPGNQDTTVLRRSVYKRSKLKPFIKGKKVKHWLHVYGGEESDGDDFIPIFEKRRKKKRILGSDNFTDKIKGYEKLEMTYHPPEFKPIINGKKVKFWKHVRISDTDMNHDEYIPIYEKRRKRK